MGNSCDGLSNTLFQLWEVRHSQSWSTQNASGRHIVSRDLRDGEEWQVRIFWFKFGGLGGTKCSCFYRLKFNHLLHLLLLQEHLQVVGPVPWEPVRHGFSAAFLQPCRGLFLPGSSLLLHGRHPKGDWSWRVVGRSTSEIRCKYCWNESSVHNWNTI